MKFIFLILLFITTSCLNKIDNNFIKVDSVLVLNSSHWSDGGTITFEFRIITNYRSCKYKIMFSKKFYSDKKFLPNRFYYSYGDDIYELIEKDSIEEKEIIAGLKFLTTSKGKDQVKGAYLFYSYLVYNKQIKQNDLFEDEESVSSLATAILKRYPNNVNLVID